MKIALLLTGQLRTYKLCMHVIKSTIIDKYDTDVFLSINTCNLNTNVKENPTTPTLLEDVKHALEFYKPVDFYICNDLNSIINKELKILIDHGVHKSFSLDKIKASLSQWYIVEKAYTLLINYTKQASRQYDFIMRVRFDNIIYSPPNIIPSNFFINDDINTNFIKYNEDIIKKMEDISKMMKIELNIPNKNQIYVSQYTNIYVNDTFWIHGTELVESLNAIYHELPDRLIKLIQNKAIGGECPYNEIMFRDFLNMHNITTAKSNIRIVFNRIMIT